MNRLLSTFLALLLLPLSLELSSASPSPLPSPLSPAFTVQYSPWDFVLAVAWSPDGKQLAVSSGVKVYLYEAETGKELQEWEVGTWGSSLLFAQPGGEGPSLLILGGRDGRIHILSLENSQEICSFLAHPTGVNGLSLRADGKMLASGGGDPMARLWDLASLYSTDCKDPKPVATLIGAAFAVPDITFSPDGSLLASVDFQAIRLRDPDTQRLVSTLGGDNPIFAIDFSPDGALLAAAGTELTARIWNTTSGEMEAVLRPPQAAQPAARAFLWTLAFSPSGGQLVGAGSRGELIFWNPNSPDTAPTSLAAHGKAISALAYSPDGRWLASGGLDAALKVWQVKP